VASEERDRPGPRIGASARFLLRSLSLRGPSFLLALLAVSVGTTVIATMLNLEAGLSAKMSRELRRYGPNLLVTPAADLGPGAAPPTLDEGSVRALASRPGGADTLVAPLLIAAGTVAAPDAEGRGGARRAGAATTAAIVGADFEALRRLYPSWRVDGAWPESGAAGAPQCLVGAALAARARIRSDRSVSVRLGPREGILAVTGLVSTGEAEDEQVLVPLSFLQEMTGLRGRISLAAVSIAGGMEAVARAGRDAESAIAGAIARPLPQIASSQGAILGKLRRLMVLLTLVILALSGICLVTTLMSMVIEREGEIGLIRSLGGGDGEILRMFVGETVILAVLGALAGVGLGAAGAGFIGARLFGAAIGVRAGVAPTVLAVSVALCLVALLVPLRHALSVQPAAALRGE
jgi:putative ABC transport system permease protein